LNKNILIGTTALVASFFMAGCSQTPEAASANDNANTNPVAATAAPTTSTRPGPDNSEIVTSTDAAGVTTETRVFHENTRVSKIVVTSRNGTHTTRVYSRSGEEKELSEGESEDVLDKTGDAIANTAGFVAEKTVEGTKKGVEVGKNVGDKTAEDAKKVGNKTAETSKTVADKTAEGAKKVGEKTVEGAKKTGKAIKRVVSP
jgi:hypothetical protein